jgi:hypothetical protein
MAAETCRTMYKALQKCTCCFLTLVPLSSTDVLQVGIKDNHCLKYNKSRFYHYGQALY